MLRQLLALELAVWGEEAVVAGGVSLRDESEGKANLLFAEIQRRVNSLESMPGAQWSPQDLKIIKEICEVVNRQGRTRY